MDDDARLLDLSSNGERADDMWGATESELSL